ncbi:hypothetical protein AB6A40_004165 [Gnathostoma spinigerum]|uniref:Uncharacterized protein n=1 Tax=Gnathostoma spinigerum TaxID=75299 RepID=A0ABD6EJ72_9BILA
MGDYQLTRARSLAVIPRSQSLERPRILVSRTLSLPDFTRYIQTSPKYKPQWSWRYYRDPYPYDDYWYDRYYYSSPAYRSFFYPRRYYSYDDYLNPYYWSWPYRRWTSYDYDYPYYYRRWYDYDYYPSYGYRYSRYYPLYWPYRSYAYDTLTTSIDRGISMYRAGLIPYSTLDRYWLTPSYWDRRFKDWRKRSLWDMERLYLPTSFDAKTRSYFTQWTS